MLSLSPRGRIFVEFEHIFRNYTGVSVAEMLVYLFLGASIHTPPPMLGGMFHDKNVKKLPSAMTHENIIMLIIIVI